MYKLSDIFEGNYLISQKYGVNKAYYFKVSGGTLKNGHEGVDWATPVGVKILAPFNGIILRDIEASVKNVYGGHIVVWDPVQKCAVWYCHLSSNTVVRGQTVKAGQVLGRTGNTGNTTGPHLHVNFCLTDAYANRLNVNNGSLGFLNILDPNLVQWKLK